MQWAEQVGEVAGLSEHLVWVHEAGQTSAAHLVPLGLLSQTSKHQEQQADGNEGASTC
jgi:hypothetical protein